MNIFYKKFRTHKKFKYYLNTLLDLDLICGNIQGVLLRTKHKYTGIKSFMHPITIMMRIFHNYGDLNNRVIDTVFSLTDDYKGNISLVALKNLYKANPSEFLIWVHSGQRYIQVKSNNDYNVHGFTGFDINQNTDIDDDKIIGNILTNGLFTAHDIANDYCKFDLRTKHGAYKYKEAKHKGRYPHISYRMALRMLNISGKYKRKKNGIKYKYKSTKYKYRNDLVSNKHVYNVVLFHHVYFWDVKNKVSVHTLHKRYQIKGTIRHKTYYKRIEQPMFCKRILGKGSKPTKAISKTAYYNLIRYKINPSFTNRARQIIFRYTIFGHPRRTRKFLSRYGLTRIPLLKPNSPSFMLSMYDDYQNDELRTLSELKDQQLSYYSKLNTSYSVLLFLKILHYNLIYNNIYILFEIYKKRYLNVIEKIKHCEKHLDSDDVKKVFFRPYPILTRSRSFNSKVNNIKKDLIKKFIKIILIYKYNKLKIDKHLLFKRHKQKFHKEWEVNIINHYDKYINIDFISYCYTIIKKYKKKH